MSTSEYQGPEPPARTAQATVAPAEAAAKTATDSPTAAAGGDSVANAIDDAELIERALRSQNKDGKQTFKTLWLGEWEGRYRSWRSASFSLCRLLAFWTGKDAHRMDRLYRQSGMMQEEWDRADYRNKTIAKAIQGTRAVYVPSVQKAERREGEREPAPGPYWLRDEGVFYADPNGEKQPLWLCSRLEVVALTRDDASENWGRMVRLVDPDGKEHRLALPMEILAGDGIECRQRLLSMGLRINPSKTARDLLGHYLQAAGNEQRARCVRKPGWYGDVFVLPDVTIGKTSERVILQSTRDHGRACGVSGALQDWQDHVCQRVHRNHLLEFAVCAAFAPPLLRLAGMQGGGFHFRSGSSTGKTTLQRVASSIWGERVSSWRTTSNALEAVAEGHNDGLLCLDELAQIDPREAAEAAYMLANGTGKQRMSRTSAVSQPASWLLLFISSGEITLSEHVATVGRRVRGGQEVRMVDIPADGGSGLGVFADLHGAKDGDSFARQLAEATSLYYGMPIRRFLEFITGEFRSCTDLVKERRASFLHDFLPARASGEVSRVAGLFALVAAAGEIAGKAGILPWEPDQGLVAAALCFMSWLSARGKSGTTDIDLAIRQVRSFLESHGASRFQVAGREDAITYNRAGYKEVDEYGSATYLILPEAFRTEICSGYDPNLVARALNERGHLVTGKGRLTLQRRIPEMGLVRVYAVKASLLRED